MTFEWAKCWRGPRTSQIPSSGSFQRRLEEIEEGQLTGQARRVGSQAQARLCMESSTSPYTSSWNWSVAALPIRTGAEPWYPASQGTSYSVSRRSPLTLYMIWSSSGSPAAARRSQSRNGRASSWYPAPMSGESVNVASRSQQNR